MYKRLAIHLGLVDVHLGPGPNAEELVDAWARDLGHAGISDVRPMLARWSAAVRRSLAEKPPRTRPNWNNDAWAELAHALAPSTEKDEKDRHISTYFDEKARKKHEKARHISAFLGAGEVAAGRACLPGASCGRCDSGREVCRAACVCRRFASAS